MPDVEISSTPRSARPFANVVQTGLVRDRDERPLDLQLHRVVTPSGQTALRERAHRFREQPVLDGVQALTQALFGVIVVNAHRAPASGSGPESTPSSTRWTVTPVLLAPAARASSIGVRPGNAGRSEGWTLTTRSREALQERRREQVHVAGEHHQLRRRAASSQSAIAASRAARSGWSSSANTAVGMPAPLGPLQPGGAGAVRGHADDLDARGRAAGRSAPAGSCRRRR